jgi:hypothetical protein
MFSVKIDIEVQAESLDYVEEKTAKLEDVISSHFDEDELVGFDFEIVEQIQDNEIDGEYDD